MYQRPGSVKHPYRLRPLAQSSADDRFISALLTKDRQKALSIMASPEFEPVIASLQAKVTSQNLVALVYERLWSLDLIEALEPFKLTNQESLASLIRQEAALAVSGFAALDERFHQLVDWLQDDVIWIKGPVLARTLYERPQFRHSRDFDLVIRPDRVASVLAKLKANGFTPIWDEAGISPQFGVGPTGSLESLAILPSREYCPCSNLSLTKDGWPYVELKCDPLDTGLKMKELQRFFADCQSVPWFDRNFCAPSACDHLMLELTHLHKHGFEGWHWLYDIHLLVSSIAEQSSVWSEFERRCHHEGISTSAWAGLKLVADRLNSPVPAGTLEGLAPKKPEWATKYLTFTTTTEFLWNTATLPALLANALLLDDRQRKLAVLHETILPEPEFLCNYYCHGATMSAWLAPFIWLLHLVVLWLPGGLIRRTFGQHLWKYKAAIETQ